MLNNNELIEILVNVNRCTKVTKGGRTFSFSSIVIIGDKNGHIGYGFGKATEIVNAKFKALIKAKKNVLKIPLRKGRTLHHDLYYKYCSSKIILKPAYPGKGVIANGIIRSICNALGIKDVIAKSFGSNNPHNLVKATIKALKSSSTINLIAKKRDKKIREIIGSKKNIN